MKGTEEDPRGLILEAYRIEGITEAQCRSIFLDWALGAPPERDTQDDVRSLLVRYADGADDHPMTATLRAALVASPKPRRRGGRRNRVPDA